MGGDARVRKRCLADRPQSKRALVFRQQKVEATIRTAHLGVVRAEEVRDDLYASIDVAADKLARSLRKLKEKAIARGNWPGRGRQRRSDPLSDAALAAESSSEEDDDALGGARASYLAPTDDEVDEATNSLGEIPASIKKVKVR